ncbi:uncharacterized protein phf11 [Heptranchias perlo]|uniref:uncharacterized protein phf11 n=1 Tax=Heptranchias perlo TaxID=212740 RepID=UPI003559D0E6
MSLKCGFCKRTKEEAFSGELLFSQDSQLVVHRRCLLFSSVPKTSKKSKSENLCGISVPAIKKKLRKVIKTKCSHCRRSGAAVKCAVRYCRKVYHYPCVRSDNGAIGENEIYGVYRVWCQKHKIEHSLSEDSNAESAEDVQDTAQPKENELEPQREQRTCNLKTKKSQRCSFCSQTEADMDCEVEGCTKTYHLHCAADDSVKLIKNIDKGVYRLYCKNHSGYQEDRSDDDKEAHGSTSSGCCRSSGGEEERSNYQEENFKWKISNKMKDDGRFRKCQKRSSDLPDGDGTLQDSSVSKAVFQECGSFSFNIGNPSSEMPNIPDKGYMERRGINTERSKGITVELLQLKEDPAKVAESKKSSSCMDLAKAKSFWTKMQTTGSVEHVFEQLDDVLNCLKQKIADGSANDQEYLKALILLNEAGIQDSSLSFDTPEIKERFQHDSEEKISEKVTISEEMEAQSVSNSCLFVPTSVIKSLAPSATCQSPIEGFIHPSFPDQLTFHQHKCSGMCIAKVTPPTPDHFKGENPLKIPILCQFQRRHAKLHWDTEVLEPPHVSYKAPCGRSLRNFKEVRDYIFETQCDFLLLDFFSFNTYVQLSRTVACKDPVVYEADISHGIEPVPVPLYNAIDVSTPQYFKYRKARLPHGYLISSSAEVFLQKCNCTDGCSDKSRCACQQLTASVNKKFSKTSGYEYKRLLRCAPSGLYECNKWCKCNERMCENRVVQHGLKARLQLFKTQEKGWGVRCIDDVDKGTFVCCYAGRVLNIVNGMENQRNEKAVNCGDISAENCKTAMPSIKGERKGSCLDSDIELIDAMEETKTDVKGEEATPFVKMSSLINTQKGNTELSGRKKPVGRKSSLHCSEMSPIERPKTKTALLQARRRKLLEQGQLSVKHSSSEEEDSNSSAQRSKKLCRTFLPFSLRQRETPSDNQKPINSDKGVLENRSSAGYGRNHPTPLGESIFESSVFSKQRQQGQDQLDKQEHKTNGVNANSQDKLLQDNCYKELSSKLPRTCSGDEQGDCCYFLDATEEGNIGRFINHSCDPNLIVQSVFVDTHDKNFPWVAFFTTRYIKAGSELTWDYSYSTGNRPEEEIPCLCGSVNCRNSIRNLMPVDRNHFLKGEGRLVWMSSVGSTGVMNMKECGLCLRSGQSSQTGKLFTDSRIAVHQNCLLYSSNLVTQNSPDFDDFGGFCITEIEKEIKRGKKLYCSLCRKKGATVGCEVKSCRKCYHYPCAIDDMAHMIESEDLEIYRILCKNHKTDNDNPTSRGTSHRENVGSHVDDHNVEVEDSDDSPEISYPKKSQSKTSKSVNQRTSTPRKRLNSSDTDESDELPMFDGTCIQIANKSKNGSKQRKLDDDRTQDKEICNSSSNHLAESMISFSDEQSPSMLRENTLGVNQVDDQLNEAVVTTRNVRPDTPPIPEETEPNDGNCSDTSTNVDEQEDQEETIEQVPTTSREQYEPATTGKAKAFWKKCKEAQCVEKIFMKIQNDLNSIQQNIVHENATNKDYDTAWAILLTMDSFQDIMSKFQSEIRQNLQHLEQEQLSLLRRESLVEEMRRIAGPLSQKSHRQK